MNLITVSAVFEKQIRRLCLNDFPCGCGSWKKTGESREGPETEETDVLQDLLSCPHSPWRHDESWSPQAQALRRLAVSEPECLHTDFIYNFFSTLRIVDEDVSVIDAGLLKFTKLEELVLSANRISEIPAENLPSTLKILELRANRISALNSLTNRPPPRLQYLGLGSNSLGSHQDIAHFTGTHWPQLVCLDLSDCEFQGQQALLNALSTLPSLRTLVLEGNPFTLAACYPGLTVDSLLQLSYLDASWISPEARQNFRGLAKMSDLMVDRASATVSVGRMRGIPDPLMNVDENAPDFPVVTYSYFITYVFFSQQTPVKQEVDSECNADTAAAVEDDASDADMQSKKNRNRETSKSDTRASMTTPSETCHDISSESTHSTSKQTWSECMDLSDTQMYNVSDLGGFKKFLNQGLHLQIEQEKVLSWPAAPEDVSVAKASQTVPKKKGGKRKDSPIKSGSTKDKSKDKKKKSAPELAPDAPIRRILGSVHVSLQSLVKGGQKVDILCDFGALHIDPEVEATQSLEKEIREDMKEESKQGGSSSPGQRKPAASKDYLRRKGKGRKKCELDAHTDISASTQLEPVTVEFSVELQKWQSVSEATEFSHQTSFSNFKS